MLAAQGLSTTVADARFAKPLDTDLVLRLAREHEVLITVEEGSIGGFGAYVLQTLAEQRRARPRPEGPLHGAARRVHRPGQPAAMYAQAGLDAKGIVAKVFEALGKDVRIDVVQHA